MVTEKEKILCSLLPNGYLVRNKSGVLLFTTCIPLSKDEWRWRMHPYADTIELPNNFFPCVKWENEPIETWSLIDYHTREECNHSRW